MSWARNLKNPRACSSICTVIAPLGEILGRSPALPKPAIVVHTCSPSIGETEAGGSGVKVHPQIHSELQASLALGDSVLDKKERGEEGTDERDIMGTESRLQLS